MTTSKNTILLRGSTDTVAEFFHAALSSILYQRGIYPPENFAPIKKYGLTVMAVKEDKLSDYLQAILKQFTG
jgi:mitotic spindle assembly checkpoint protein MAD2